VLNETTNTPAVRPSGFQSPAAQLSLIAAAAAAAVIAF